MMTSNDWFLVAREAVGASYDAHGHAVTAARAYDFMRELHADDNPGLPAEMPQAFRDSYLRIARERAAGNPFAL